MPTISTFLMFNDQTDDAIALYSRIFPDAKVTQASRGPDGKIFSGVLQLPGQTLMMFNGGAHFSFSEGSSLFVSCDDQAEVDQLWELFVSSGGAAGRCGWLKDKFGVSWQIIPTALGRLLGDKDRARAQRVMQAMMKMGKIDIAGLESA